MSGPGGFGGSGSGFGQGGFGQGNGGGFGGGHGSGGGFGGGQGTGAGFDGAPGFGAGPGQPPPTHRPAFDGGFVPVNDDYRFGGAAPGGIPTGGAPGTPGHKAPFGRRMSSMSFFGAPMPLLIAFALQLVTAGIVIWRLVERWRLPERPITGVGAFQGYEEQIASLMGATGQFRPNDLPETTIFWSIVLVVLLAMAFFTVKGENWARIVLTLLCVAGVFLLAVKGFAIAGLASVLTLPLLWLPVNKAWFGQR